MAGEAIITRRNATKVIGLFDAGSIDVCRSGDLVALHVHTTSGEVIIRMRERDFVVSCRSPRDANGHPLRNSDQLLAAQDRKEAGS